MDFSQHKTTRYKHPLDLGRKGYLSVCKPRRNLGIFSLLISIKKHQHFRKLVSTKSTEGAQKQTLKY